MLLTLLILFGGVVFLRGIIVALPKFFLVPSQQWTNKIRQVLDYPKPIYLRVGWKRSSFRRRLILASENPSFYNNYNNNKLKISREDIDIKDVFIARMKHRAVRDPQRRKLYGFFHPYANNGGGGEKVLWQAVHSTLACNDNNIAIVYTVNYNAPLEITQKVFNKFNIHLDTKRVVFIYIRRFGHLIDNEYWKHFTLIGQIFGSIMVSLECMFELSPDIWIDTIGLPGSYLLVSRILKIPILAYVHYPIIQQDMFTKLKLNLDGFKVSDWKILAKFGYWKLMFYFYVYLGSLVDITLANGSWTFNHLAKIWVWNNQLGSTMTILYPPCGTEFPNPYISKQLELKRANKMIYIAQFRPEKRHDLVLTEYVKFLEEFQTSKTSIKQLPTIIFLGSCRTKDDTKHLNYIKQLVDDLKLKEYVEFIVDCSYDEILRQLATVKFGLNAMWNEHFGIGVVEYMVNGVIPIVHGSAGPLLDIVVNESKGIDSWKSDTGVYFKSSSDPDFDKLLQDSNDYLRFRVDEQIIEFPQLAQLFNSLFITSPLSEQTLHHMAQLGRKLASQKFSNAKFDKAWRKYCKKLSDLEETYREEKRSSIDSVH